MEEKKIDTVNAEDLITGDIIKVPDYGFVNVVTVTSDDALVYVYTDADITEPFTYAWDDRIALYGY